MRVDTTLTVAVDIGGLSAAVLSATVTVTDPDASNSPKTCRSR